MLRVRPGVLLVRASFAPTRELITLDLPTLDRPRNAISGTLGAGKCVKSLADNINRAMIRIHTVSSVGLRMASAGEKISQQESSLKTERTFGFHVLFLDRMQFVPERESAGDDQSDENADQKEPAISREGDQQNRYDADRDDESCRSLQAESRAAAGFRFHKFYSTAGSQTLSGGVERVFY